MPSSKSRSCSGALGSSAHSQCTEQKAGLYLPGRHVSANGEPGSCVRFHRLRPSMGVSYQSSSWSSPADVGTYVIS